ncbi:IS3 family transposase [Micromonospora sp. DR5-3]|uniref:IS3 family transposase n=1 Tax=unclassified Micromonospora TaxID=2617518 RepID=UPI0011D8A9A0|nr:MULTISPECIES: IS3 family transposase [unclassified Micromonospora]MCW3817837.1 IS3 family transposase [Micromonospora sp. DR5-3]TYC19110.1 IS3 family transposase [Micromonospora sp. MP36]
MNVYPFIEAEQAGRRNVKRACELMQVPRSAYYQHSRGQQSERERVDHTLSQKIVTVHEASRGTYGAPRIHAELTAAGHRHGRKRIAWLMRRAGLAGRCPRRWRTTTIPDPAAPQRPDLVNRDFGTDPAAVDTRWCGDITNINTWEGWLYLATVIDLASRRVVGWAVADHLRTDLVDAAFSPTPSSGAGPPPGWSSTPIAGNTPVPSTPASRHATACGYRWAGAGGAGTTSSWRLSNDLVHGR